MSAYKSPLRPGVPDISFDNEAGDMFLGILRGLSGVLVEITLMNGTDKLVQIHGEDEECGQYAGVLAFDVDEEYQPVGSPQSYIIAGLKVL
jgi:hypothetical protein